MKPVIEHQWDLTEVRALALQKTLAAQVITEDRFDEIRVVAGVDVAYGNDDDQIKAAVVLLDADTLEVVETAVSEDEATFPYIPGLFSFREMPSLIKAFESLNTSPDLVVCDGHGYAHPRRFGLACHLGVVFDIPAIGCGKTRLIGEYDEPGINRGDYGLLLDNGETVGAVLRTQTNVKPVFVSTGHRISLESACKWILQLSPKYRLPETTRAADQLGRA